ncbi:MAG: hypothetical protein ABL993_09695 [Vicinamibacterales bacterium]
MLGLSSAGLAAAHLSPESIAGWAAYVSTTERRIGRELRSAHGFLAMDFDENASEDRRAVLGGAVVVRKMTAADLRGGLMSVPSARVHHWRGEVLIPGVAVAQLVAQLKNGAPPNQPDDVLQSRVIERGPDWMRVYLKLHRRRFVTVVYNTEHLVTFARHGATRATSRSTATKIAEVSDADTPRERELPLGEDRGFLWHLNAYWRYEEVAGGVIAECESISLSRDVPSVLRYLVDPLVESTARESMERTLSSLKARHARS